MQLVTGGAAAGDVLDTDGMRSGLCAALGAIMVGLAAMAGLAVRELLELPWDGNPNRTWQIRGLGNP